MIDSVKETFKASLKFGYRKPIVILGDSLRTTVYIRKQTFEDMIRSGRYVLLGYNPQCSQLCWISRDSTLILFCEIVKVCY